MSEAKKADHGKIPLGLIPSEFEEALGEILAHGAKRYGSWNWTKGFDDELRLYSAIRRHLGAWHKGEDTDPDSGLPHLMHAACGIMFLYISRLYNLGIDTRWKRPQPEADGLSALEGDDDGGQEIFDGWSL